MSVIHRRDRGGGGTCRRGRTRLWLWAWALIVAACSGGDDLARLPSDSEFFNPDGSSATLADYEGTPLVLNFFASWCGPCKAELPEFEEVSNELGDEVQFLGVNTDFEQDAWLQLVADTGVTYPTVFQPSNELFSASGGLGMPTTVFIADDGTVQHTFSGALNKATLRRLIDTHLS
ncbi:MAG: TlpA family protein disulfide reductase [Acidimicrobiales bacterium]|nr:TlpA family protein disulfide reductase [Acidimicrobiales bacterium]